jgi:hypothetical protein
MIPCSFFKAREKVSQLYENKTVSAICTVIFSFVERTESEIQSTENVSTQTLYSSRIHWLTAINNGSHDYHDDIVIISSNSVLPQPYPEPTKLNLSLYTPRRRLGESRYSSYLFSTSALDESEGQRHAPAALYPRNLLYRRLGGPQSRSEHRG